MIGAGRAGPSIASALRANGHAIFGVAARSAAGRERTQAMLPGVPLKSEAEVAGGADIVFLAVPDEAIGPLADDLDENWHPGQLVVHLSGAASLEPLEAAARKGALVLSMHPVMTFTGTSLDVGRLAGAAIAITGPALVLPLAEALARDLGGVPFHLDESAKPLYHAALAHGANHLVTVLSQARQMLVDAGVDDPESVLRPLVEAAASGALEFGIGALTGPVVRGDQKTIDQHLEALEDSSARDTYRWLSRATAAAWHEYQMQLAGREDEE